MTPKQEKDVQFPISDAAIALIDSRIACLDPTAAEEIRALAPDPGRQKLDQDPLWLLNKASNRDKHRELPIVAAAVGSTEYALSVSDGTDYFRDHGPQRLELNAHPVALFEYARSPGVQAQITFACDVLFDKGIEVADREVVAALRWFHDHIRDTVFQRLEPYLS